MVRVDYRLEPLMADAGIARYYDRLNRWNEIARLVGYGGGRERLTVHRALADPAAHGRPTTSRLHDILLAHLPELSSPRVLDAGCGLGGTMLLLAERYRARVTGLTLSPSQASTARAAIAAAGLADTAAVTICSYDTPPAGPFDLVLALESLAHSPDPGVSVAALSAVVAPGGRFVVVDDMPESAAEGTADLQAFKRGWRSPVLWPRIDYLRAFNRHGLLLEHDLDLSAEVRPRPLGRIRLLERANRLAALVPSSALREVMDSHMAGLALERMLRRRLMRYRMLIARRP
jgi:SAM-dependent methyltransferase